jgi:uncharacterized protein YndB with AHSA1/START domain
VPAHTVERTTAIAAPPERVWQAWVSEINRWWSKPYFNDHERVTGLRLEPRVGGLFVEEWGADGAGFLIGQVVEWLPPRRLAYTWSERGWGGVVTVAHLEFEPDGSGGTRLHFRHEGFERLPDGQQTRDGYQSGWEDLATRLKKYPGRHAAALRASVASRS